ncbi:MAG: phosphotransferase [Gammaproteobacteria bacterium]|nr:phosphotransferase [Gammaproteobacteria bacterium]
MTIISKPIKKKEIKKLIPHSGNMCLIEEVLEADKQSLKARSQTHLSENNPLRVNGQIHIVNAVEYAAQAMAIHGALLSLKDSDEVVVKQGYIVSLRNINTYIEYLPVSESDLLVAINLLMGSETGYSYEFEVKNKNNLLISGRISIFLSEQ